MRHLLLIAVVLYSFNCFAQLPTQWTLPNEDTTEWGRMEPYGSSFSFHFNHGRFVNSDSSINYVMNMGWNVSPGGGEVVSGYGRPNMQFESNYLNVYGVRLQEIHFGFGDKRVMHSEWNVSTGFLTTIFRADNMNFTDGSNNVRMQLYNGALILDNGTTIRSVNNNAAFLSQYSTTGSLINIARVDNTNAVLLGGGTVPVKMNSLVLNGATVSLGDANSGGAGYRCLRVAN